MSVFCFDMDEVLVRGCVITQASRMLAASGKIDKIYTGKHVISWELDGIPKCVKDKTMELFNDAQYAVWNKNIIVGVEVFINYLKSNGHTLYILTARPATLHGDTNKFILEHFGNDIFTDVRCVDGCTNSKIMELAKLNPDYYFDDNIAYCEEARLLGIDTYMICNEHTPWNHKMAHHEITRIKNVSFFPFEKV